MFYDNSAISLKMRCGLTCLNTGASVPLKEVQNIALIGASLVHVDSNLQYVNETNTPIEANFTFPLDTGSAVYRFEAEVNGRLLIAECQEKQQARDTYQQAVNTGHTAVLLEEHQDTDDVFVCRIGNLPPFQKAILKICYVSELPHDPSGALRFTLPTVLNPRYGVEHNTGPVNNRTEVVCINPGSYVMSLDITVQSQQKILSIVSEKDQLKLSPTNSDHMWKVTVQFVAGTKVDHDVTIMINYEDMHQPQAIVERGLKGQDKGLLNMDVLMLSFYPKFDLKLATTVGEFIFIVDRSGSMAGSRIASARDTLLLMIKSLPVGCFFNLYGFGDTFQVLFQRDSSSSVEYTEENMLFAIDHVQRLEADMGGTQIMKPIEHMYSKPCLPGHPRQVILLTDGDVWNVGEVLSLVRRNNNTTRMFSVGIGEGASTALVKGLARAGKGRAEFVKGNDRLQTKVVSLLKSAVQPVVTNVQVDLELPPEVTGAIIPQECPSIFSGEELIIYGVLNGSMTLDTIYGNIVLRGHVENQSFEHKLTFEGHHQDQQLDTSLPVHRLSAKALIRELQEEEMGNDKPDNKDKILLASTAANVISKYSSFVGVDKQSKVALPEQSYLQMAERVCQGYFGAGHGYFGAAPGGRQHHFAFGGGLGRPPGGMFGASFGGAPASGGFGSSGQFGVQSGGMFGSKPIGFGSSTASGSFGSSNGFAGQGQSGGMFGAKPMGFGGSAAFGCSRDTPPQFGAQPQPQQGVFGSGVNMFGAKPATEPAPFGAAAFDTFGSGGSQQSNVFGSQPSSGMFGAKLVEPVVLTGRAKLIVLQGFEGSWILNSDFASFLGTTCEALQQVAPTQNYTVWATCLALAWLHMKESPNKEEWVMIENKALLWLKQQGISDEEVKQVFSTAQSVMFGL